MRPQPRPPAAQASPAPSIHRAPTPAATDPTVEEGRQLRPGLGLQAASTTMFFFFLCFTFQQGLASQTAALAVRRTADWRPERLGPNRDPFHRGWRFDLLLRVLVWHIYALLLAGGIADSRARLVCLGDVGWMGPHACVSSACCLLHVRLTRLAKECEGMI